MLLCKQEEVGIQLSVEQVDWKDDSDDEPENQELESHYLYMEKIQEVSSDAATNYGPIFNDEPLQKDDDDLANERDLLASLIDKLKCEIDDSKKCNKLLESSNKILVDKLKSQIEDLRNKNKSLELSNTHFREANNELQQTNQMMIKDLVKFQDEIENHNDVKYMSKVELECAKAKTELMTYKTESHKSMSNYSYQICKLNKKISNLNEELVAHQRTISNMSKEKEAQKHLYKTREDKEHEKVIVLEKKIKVLDDIVYKTGQSVQTINMLNQNCKTGFVKPKLLKKAKSVNPRLYDISCYNDNLALMLAPESDESIHLAPESRSKLSDLIKPFDYKHLINLKAQIQDKDIAISELKKLIAKLKGKSVDTNFEKPSVIRQPNAFKSQRQSILGKPVTFSDSLARKDFSKSKLVNKNDVSKVFSKPVSTQILPQNVKSILKNTNVIAPRIVSRPKLKSNQLEDSVMLNNSQGKKQEVEDHHRKFKFSNNKTSVTACNDSLNAKTTNLVEIILFIVDSGWLKHITGNLKLLTNFVKKFLGTIKFGNDQITPILGYRDLVQENVTITRVYYVEGMSHNLFFVGQFCDANLEFAFRKSACYIRDLKGNDLLICSRGIDLYYITLQDTSAPNPIFLMAKATSSQAWLWHHRLPHLNFDTINLLSKYDIVKGLPKLKFVKDHLCSSYGENLDKIKEKGDACIFVGYSTQSRAYWNINQAETNKENAQVKEDKFINIFSTPIQERGETSSRYVDSSNMHTFYQRHPSEHRWTKDHPLEQVIGNPSQSIRTRRQLETDGEMCMFALTMSRTEPKKIKEAMVLISDGLVRCRRNFTNLIELDVGISDRTTLQKMSLTWLNGSLGFKIMAGCIDTHKSTSSSIQFLDGDKLVGWSSKKQDCTSISLAEVEYHFIKEQVEKGIVELFFVGTEYQLADLFTKALPEDRFKYLVRRLGMRCLTPEELEVLANESA
ncbi:retrovirus-related pol polyprotein from transposon TNT 1-94 [Tanacetum coccineum]